MRRLFLLLLLTLSLLFLAICLFKNIFPRKTAPAHAKVVEYKGDLGRVFNILITASDARMRNKVLEPKGRADIVNIVHINLDKGIVNLINIPRDMLIHIPGYTKAASDTDFCNMDKINHSYFFGKEKLLKDCLARNYNIPIHRYLTVNLYSFQDIFSFLLPYLKNISLRNRVIRNAREAKYLLQERRIWKRDDIDRGRNSLIFIKTIAENIWPIVSKPIFREDIIRGVMKIIGENTDLTFEDIIYILSSLAEKGFSPNNILMATLIGYQAPVYLNRYNEILSCYLPIYSEIRRQVAHFIFESDDSVKSYMEDEPIKLPAYVLRRYYPVETLSDSIKRDLEPSRLNGQTQEY